ncbi:M23 family metallopeptidase [Polaromonas sp.]|uniref:M23 family metallopeptidase n=1 Tax=Polaromonas sp. TaxID=1869339 RepID=UPI003752B85C
MTRTHHPRRWRQALILGAVLAGLAGVVIGTWFRPAATTTPSPSSVNTPTADVVAVIAPSGAAAAEPAPNTDATPAVLAVPADASDLSRLRARGLMIPVKGFSAPQLSDNYTQGRAGGALHEALDIMAPRGTPVLAVEDGPIAKLFLSKPGGITLYQFDPSGEFAYYYAHLDAYADGIAEGGSVRKGQVIGYVGSTGNASLDAPHLHFAIYKLGAEKQWWRGTPINPFLVWRDARP